MSGDKCAYIGHQKSLNTSCTIYASAYSPSCIEKPFSTPPPATTKQAAMKRASTKNELCSEASDLQYASPQYFAASIKASLINCMLFLSRWNVLTL